MSSIDKLTEIEQELEEVMRRTKYGWFGEHVATHRHVNRALELIRELKAEVPA